MSAPVAASINTAMKGVVSEQTRKAMTEYEAQVLAIREKTARLRALRLATEAQAQNEEPPPKTKVRPLKNRGNR